MYNRNKRLRKAQWYAKLHMYFFKHVNKCTRGKPFLNEIFKKCYKCKPMFSFSYEKKTIHKFKQNTGITLHLVKQKKPKVLKVHVLSMLYMFYFQINIVKSK